MNDPFAEPSDTRQAILGAAFRALCEHGYANVTIQRIGDEFDKSPSLVYHHYDGKDDLLIDLLEFLLDEFEASIADGGTAESADEGAATPGGAPEMAPTEAFDRSARDQLDDYLAAAVDPASLDGAYAPDARFVTVMTDLRSQAASDEAYRDHFDRSDRVFGEYLERLVREAAAEVADDAAEASGNGAEGAGDGAEGPGDDRTVDAAEVAATLQTFATGGMFRWSTTNETDWVADSRAGMDRYLEAMLPLVETAGTEE